jgi:hypothetical protein
VRDGIIILVVLREHNFYFRRYFVEKLCFLCHEFEFIGVFHSKVFYRANRAYLMFYFYCHDQKCNSEALIEYLKK